MSLEQTIADLVAASNNLTGAVNNKMGEIDQKVDEATASVPDTIRGLSEQKFYIDAQYGDDANGDGSISKPYKTISKTNGLLVNGSRATFNLKAGQTHVIDGYGPFMQTGLIVVSSWDRESAGAKPIIHWKPWYSAPTNNYRGRGFGVESGSVIVRGCDIVTDYNSESDYPLNSDASFFGYANSSYSVVVHEAAVTLKNAPLIISYSGYAGREVFIANSDIGVTENANGMAKLLWNRASTYHTFKLDVHSVTLLNGLTWAELVDYYADKRNILTNLELV